MYLLNDWILSNHWNIFSNIQFDFAIRDNVSDLIIASKFILVIVFHSDWIFLLNMPLSNNLLNDKIFNLLNGSALQYKLIFVYERVISRVVQLYEIGFGLCHYKISLMDYLNSKIYNAINIDFWSYGLLGRKSSEILSNVN